MQDDRETRGNDSAFIPAGSARARGRRVNVVDLVVYMYILLCFLVLLL